MFYWGNSDRIKNVKVSNFKKLLLNPMLIIYSKFSYTYFIHYWSTFLYKTHNRCAEWNKNKIKLSLSDFGYRLQSTCNSSEREVTLVQTRSRKITRWFCLVSNHVVTIVRATVLLGYTLQINWRNRNTQWRVCRFFQGIPLGTQL